MSRVRDRHSAGRRAAARLGLVSDPYLPSEQRRLVYRQMMRGLPVPSHLADAAIAYAGRLRLLTWIGVVYLLLGAGWLVRAVVGSSAPRSGSSRCLPSGSCPSPQGRYSSAIERGA